MKVKPGRFNTKSIGNPKKVSSRVLNWSIAFKLINANHGLQLLADSAVIPRGLWVAHWFVGLHATRGDVMMLLICNGSMATLTRRYRPQIGLHDVSIMMKLHLLSMRSDALIWHRTIRTRSQDQRTSKTIRQFHPMIGLILFFSLTATESSLTTPDTTPGQGPVPSYCSFVKPDVGCLQRSVGL